MSKHQLIALIIAICVLGYFAWLDEDEHKDDYALNVSELNLD